ncbi:MAG: hypothetical protein ACR2N4_15195 [Jatrophihabitans sp.]
MPNFEVFTQRASPLAGVALVTIQKRGTLSLNRSAFAALCEPEAVELLFDRTARVIGLRHTQPEAAHAHLVRKPAGRGGPFVISAIAFIRFYAIDIDRSLRWQARLEHGVLCVELSSAATPVTSNRAAHPV